MKFLRTGISLLIACSAAGCFTWKETPAPTAQFTPAPQGRDVKVQVNGFAAIVTDYIPTWGYQTYYVHGGFGPRHRHGGHYETAVTETLLPQVHASEAYLARARNLFEENGFLLRAPAPDYLVEVDFAGPFLTEGERTAQVAWTLCSIFSAEYAVQTWTAKLKIYDARTQRLLLTRDCSQKYEYGVWSPLFFIGLSGATKNEFNYMQNWCLSMLTDQVCAEATRFLSTR